MDPRSLPSVDALARRLDAPHAVAVRAARAVIEARRADLAAAAAAAGGDAGAAEGDTAAAEGDVGVAAPVAAAAGDTAAAVDLEARARAWLAADAASSLRRVLNATGVLLHTNLGRAPLAAAAREAVARVAEGYCNVELDLAGGGRGSRHDHVDGLLRELTGAEAGLAVNNGAGAALLAVAALGARDERGEVVVSRGQLVEIGGGFRIPEVVEQAGARLVEVGTTNRTRVADYDRAISPRTGAILRAHQSNFRQLGFVEEVGIEALCGLGVPVIDDVGSGLLAEDGDPVLGDEPSVRRSVAAGAALTVFSGDKLLGGPQAGLLVGTAEAVGLARRHPLARALRADKLTLAALEATLRLHRDPDLARAELPLLAMLHADPAALEARAARLAAATGGEVVQAVSRVGGGALPLAELPGPVVALGPDAPSSHAARDGAPGRPVTRGHDPDRLAAALRAGDPPVLARIEAGRVLLDPRTLTDAEAERVADAVVAARREIRRPGAAG